MKERIYYIKEGEWFVGKPVNVKGVVAQAKTLEDLKHKIKLMSKMMINLMNEILDQEEPFELVESENPNIWLTGEREDKLIKKLERYQEIFGDID
jgi:predicted RNase H-like HicB family nuclease